ncbi:hypothetical protein L7F22_012236 [Adiantum nelumboides]|nr:hypothetical protein [Adiantum nelumboides]
MSLRDALECDDLENVVCYTPVHQISIAVKSRVFCGLSFELVVVSFQDGSCNGLQHYAALGRDIGGAESVNLFCCEKPADVYTGVANRFSMTFEIQL